MVLLIALLLWLALYLLSNRAFMKSHPGAGVTAAYPSNPLHRYVISRIKQDRVGALSDRIVALMVIHYAMALVVLVAAITTGVGEVVTWVLSTP